MMTRWNGNLIGCAGVMIGAVAGMASAQPVPTHDDVVYATVGGRDLHVDLYLPSTPGLHPVVIWIHGGGWAGGTNASPAGVQELNSAGIAVASTEYRLTSQESLFGGEPVIWPAQIHDVKAVTRFLRANASAFQLDGSRFGCWGTSAGGHLSAVLALSAGDPFLEGTVGDFVGTDSSVQVGVDFFGPTDLLFMNADVTTPPGSQIDHDDPSSPESRLLGWDQPGQGVGDIRDHLNNRIPPYDDLVALARSAAPVFSVDPTDPPMYIAHGDQDTSVALGQSQRLADRCAAQGIEHTFTVAEGFGHGFLGPEVNTAAIEFLIEHLTRPCHADLNADGILDLFDISAFLGAFSTMNPIADFTGDGIYDLFDVSAFLGAFNAGCP